MELQSFLQCLKMLRLFIRTSHLTLQPERIVGDSECTVAALRKQDSALAPYFQNHVAEAHEIMREIEDLTGREVEVMIMPGTQNTTDLITRDTGMAADISSPAWQHGPSYLFESPDTWPHHTLVQNGGTIPESENRKHQELLDNQIDFPT